MLYIFALIGTVNKQCVEICAGAGSECHTANLIIHHHLNSLLVDGDPEMVEEGRHFFRRHRSTCVYPPKYTQARITRENINPLLEQNGFKGPVDLLSLDVDGVDYWLWDALEVVSPRVVILEYADVLGAERACTVPYHDDFRANRDPETGTPHGFFWRFAPGIR